MTKEEIQKRLAEIKKEQDFHSDALSGLAEQVQQLSQMLYTLKTGINIGDKVKFKDGKVEKIGTITGWAYRWNNEASPIASIHNSDGEPGKRKTSYWDADKFEKI